MNLKEVYSSLVETPSDETIKKIQNTITRAGGKPYVVGGAVRDEMLPDTPASKDIDFLITGMELKKIAQVLRSLGKVDEVGKSFGVVKATIDGEEFDFAIPRTGERKTGTGHADFDVDLDPHATPESDLSRRDFTFNALAKDSSGRIIDLFGGQDDINRKLVRAVGNPKERFSEDPLRILRALQFAVRFGFDIEEETGRAIEQMRTRLSTIAPERNLEEFSKAWTKGKDPTKFVELLDEYKVGETLFGPEFDPIAVDFTGTKEEVILANFVAFFMNGGDTKKIRATNDMMLHLNLVKGAMSDDQVWSFASPLDRDRIPLVVKILQAIWRSTKGTEFASASKKMSDSLKLPLGGKELKVSGQDLMKLGLKGPEIGKVQRKLLSAIHSGEIQNNPQDIRKTLVGEEAPTESLSLINVLQVKKSRVT